MPMSGVTTGSASKTQALTDNMTEYTFVLDCASSSKVTIGSTSNYIAVSSIQIYAGDATSVNMLAASETGGQTTRTITGITNKYYTVSNLKTGATFNYKVKAIYTDGSESSWSNVQSVTLSEEAPAATPTLTVSKTSLSLATDLGETATATFKVTGADLTGNVTLKLTDNNGVYSITPTTITAANAANGVNVTVTYNPAAAGTHTGTITVASTGAESKTVALTGTATINKATPVMNSATGISSTAFTANWTHNVLTAGVSSYSLYVNLVSQPSEPEDPEEPESTLLASLDGMVKIAANGGEVFLGTNAEEAKPIERPQMYGTFSYDFYIARAEATCGEFNELMRGETGITLDCTYDSIPATDVSYYDAVLFANNPPNLAEH